MANRESSIRISGFRYRHWMHRQLLAVLLGAVVVAGSGCTSAFTMKMKDAFPDSGSLPLSGAAVTVLPVQESPAPGRYTADQTYLGKGLSALMGLGPLFIPPVAIVYGEFHADTPRTDIVRMAVLSRLKHHGVPATYQAEGGVDGLKMLPKSRLGLSLNLRTFDVDTSELFIYDTLIVSFLGFNGVAAHAVLDCRVWQQGQASPLWEGIGEGRYDTSEFDKKHPNRNKNYKQVENLKNTTEKVWPSVVGEAISIAVDQCLTQSGLLENRAGGSNQRNTTQKQR